jgi:hypothetical protein
MGLLAADMDAGTVCLVCLTGSAHMRPGVCLMSIGKKSDFSIELS